MGSNIAFQTIQKEEITVECKAKDAVKDKYSKQSFKESYKVPSKSTDTKNVEVERATKSKHSHLGNTF